ncbi:collagenase [Colwellia psychrerythraea]|uniref:Peptidase M9A collagenase n=1 Tax=Colwellia psychrerythraea TaxID=28229 RepID=A0A099KQD5_COLPS|nr:collagenase [Colwellia psychrerythraea]KGJ91883.1 peptidase M9A collagenase [Colwellia psychrerythraea]
MNLLKQIKVATIVVFSAVCGQAVAENSLSQDTPITGISALTDNEALYYIDLTTRSDLAIDIAADNGDADLFVTLNGETVCWARNGSTSQESCAISNAEPGRYEITIKAFAAFNNLILSAGTQLLTYQYNCEGAIDNIIIRTTDDMLDGTEACQRIVATEARFHQVFPGSDLPLDGDLNETLYINVFSSHEEYENLGRDIFNQNSDTGVYLESAPESVNARANVITFNARDDWSDGESFIWAFTHESIHYLDGRYHKKGRFGGYTGSHSIDWWTEGLAEWLSKYDESMNAKLALSPHSYTLLDIFDSTYDSDVDTYAWGALAVQYLAEQQAAGTKQLINAMRIGDWSTYDSLLETFSKDYQQGFETWKKGQLLDGLLVNAKPLILGVEQNTTAEFGHLYYIDIDETTNNFSAVLTGGGGNFDMYIAKDRLPNMYDTDAIDCFSINDDYNNEERCNFAAPETGRYYILLDAPGYYISVNATLLVSEQVASEHVFERCQLELPYYDRTNITAELSIANNQAELIKLYWLRNNNKSGKSTFITDINAGSTWIADNWVVGDRLILAHSDYSCIGVAALDALNNTLVVAEDDSIAQSSNNNDETFSGICAAETAYATPQDIEAHIALTNTLDQSIRIYGLNSANGQRSRNTYAEIAEGEQWNSSGLNVGEKLVITDANNNCLDVSELTGNDNQVNITEAGTDNNSQNVPYGAICVAEQSYKPTDLAAVINIVNEDDQELRLYWLVPETGMRYSGREAVLAKGGSWSGGQYWQEEGINWYQGEKVVITDKYDNCLSVSTMEKSVTTTIVTSEGITSVFEEAEIGATCANEQAYDDVFSLNVGVSVTNELDETVTVMWLDTDGSRGSWMSDLTPGQSWDRDNWKLGDRLVITNQYGSCLDAPRLDGLSNNFTVTPPDNVEKEILDIPTGDVGLTCDAEQAYDDRTDITAAFSMTNTSEQAFKAYWLSTSGNRSSFMGSFAPGQTFSDDHWLVGDRMVITDKFDNCLDVAILDATSNQFKVTLDSVNNIDSDHDGMDDEFELANGLNVGIDDSQLDADNDGLSNIEEYLSGTNPQNEDSDGDGVNDKDDFAPNNPDVTEAPEVTILVIDDDNNGPDVLDFYTEALDALYLGYETWDTENSDNEPTVEQLSQYQQVIWFTGGNDSDATGPSTESETALASYMDNGGCLMFSSQDYRYNRKTTDFAKEYFAISTISEVDGAKDEVIASDFLSGLGNFALNPLFKNYSDAVTLDGAQAIFENGDGEVLGSYVNNGVYQSVFLGFALDAIVDVNERVAILAPLIADCAEIGNSEPGNNEPVISGTPETSVVAGNSYNFIPLLSNIENDGLLFSIENKPHWADFNSTTGELSGAPLFADIGTTTDIIISVNIDEIPLSLPSFSLTVTEAAEIPTNYCNITSNNNSYEWIESISIGEFNNQTGQNDEGYGDYTSSAVEIAVAQPVNIELVSGYSGSIYQEKWIVWFDFNQNNEFDESTEKFYLDRVKNSYIGDLVIPAQYLGITTRMRVVMSANSDDIVCGSIAYGEIEDYTVTFIDTAAPPTEPEDVTELINITATTPLRAIYNRATRNMVASATLSYNNNSAQTLTQARVYFNIIANGDVDMPLADGVDDQGRFYQDLSIETQEIAVGESVELPIQFVYGRRTRMSYTTTIMAVSQ